ncbi:MAG: hydrogenase expression/formation protein HypE, partial [Desulfovibrionaceae bacterium]|nr:hydrogenase expression/formation protein HypE [Desulfovibrionaceae bacterium]
TKVVPKGACDGIFINTTGLGEIWLADPPSGHKAKVNDRILLSGAMGDHGLTIMNSREELNFWTDVQSDSAPLNFMIEGLLKNSTVHVLRDPTRGGLATTLNEIALQSQVGIEIEEQLIPIHESVRSACSFLGLDPLYLANEGKCLCIVPEDQVESALASLRADPLGLGQEACEIGRVTNEHIGKVILKTPIGGARILSMLEGAQLPRIC